MTVISRKILIGINRIIFAQCGPGRFFKRFDFVTDKGFAAKSLKNKISIIMALSVTKLFRFVRENWQYSIYFAQCATPTRQCLILLYKKCNFFIFQFRSSAKETEWTEKRNVQIESQTETGEKRREKRFACRFGLFGKTKGQRKAGQRFRKNAKNQSHFVWFGLSRRRISTISTTKEKEVIISRKISIFCLHIISL